MMPGLALSLCLTLMGSAPGSIRYEAICAGHIWTYVLFLPNHPHEVLIINAGSDPTATALRARLQPDDGPALEVLAVLLTGGGASEAAGLRGLPSETPTFIDRADILLALGQARPQAFAPWVRWRLHRPPPLSTPPQPVSLATTMRWKTMTVTAMALPGHTSGALGYIIGDMLFIGSTPCAREANLSWKHVFEDAQPKLARETHEELCRAARCAKIRWIAPSRGPVVPTEAWCPQQTASNLPRPKVRS